MSSSKSFVDGRREARATFHPESGYRTYRWRNGLGSAMEIATASPADGGSHGPAWTLSVATVDADVAFSAFPGYSRRLMALSEAGLSLIIDGKRLHLDRWEVADFDGEVPVSSVGVAEPTIDLNLMVDRDRFCGSLQSRNVNGPMSLTAEHGSTHFVVVLDGAVEADGRAMTPMDAVSFTAGTLTLDGPGTVAVADLRPAPHPLRHRALGNPLLN